MVRTLFAALALVAAAAAVGAVPAKPQFNADIRPILSGHCFACHGPDEKHREAHLRLDVREEALRERDGTRAIVPGEPEESEVLARVVSHDPEDAMPPPKSKRPPLSEEEIATVRRWIEQGAEYQGHWAFLPLRDEAPPRAARRPNPIDRFIRARLEREGLRPSPEADRATLIRRVSLDLTGLLPSPEEVAAFVAETRAGRVREAGRCGCWRARITASAGAGIGSTRRATRTRMATRSITSATMWPYRDWVIKALNDDLPFDRFTVEQLAGDLLPQPAKSQLIATGFHRNTLINEEGGSKPRAVPHRGGARPREYHRRRLARAHRRLRAMPQPQVRPDLASRVLRAVLVLQLGRRREQQGRHGRGRARRGFRHGPDRGGAAEDAAPKAPLDEDSRRSGRPRSSRACANAAEAQRAPSRGRPRNTWSTRRSATAASSSCRITRCSATGALPSTIPTACWPGPACSASPRCGCGCSPTIRCRIAGPGLAGNGNFVLTQFEASAGGVSLPIARGVCRSRAAGLSRGRGDRRRSRRPGGRSMWRRATRRR